MYRRILVPVDGSATSKLALRHAVGLGKDQRARVRLLNVIVMGTHGLRGLNRLLLGSDAERVLREAPVPVLLIPAQRPKRTQARRK